MSKIEVVKQQDLKDCGACSLSCIIKYYGGYVPIEKIRDDTCTTTSGTTAFHLIKAALAYGFEAMGVKVEDIDSENIYLPTIAHLNLKNGLQHFVVVYQISKTHVYLMDPAKGKVKMPKEEFLAIWDRVLILLHPVSKNILKMENDMQITNLFLKLIKNNLHSFIVIILINIFLMIMSIIGSFYFQIAISSIESQTDINFLKFIIMLFFFITLFKVISDYLSKYYLNFFNKNLDTVLFTDFLSHVFHLPLKFMQNRTTGEITSRIQELSEIKNFMAEIFTSVFLNSILIVGAIIALYLVSAQLFLILCLVVGIYLIVGLLFSKPIYAKCKKNIEEATNFNSILVENVEMNTSIKNLNLTDIFLKKLENQLILMFKSNFDCTRFLNNIDMVKNIIFEIGLFLVTTFGIFSIYRGNLHILNLVTFNSIVLYLFNPIKEMIDLIPKYNYLKASFNKLSEFINVAQEDDKDGLLKMDDASIEIKDLSYSYNKFTNVLENISLSIKSGEKVLLCGPSGKGKSTLCKALYRSLDMYKGEILVSNASEKDFRLNTIRENILYVGQNENIFTGTIMDNIVCGRSIRESDLLKVMKICQLEEIVSKRPNRYNTIINAAQNNLSGGEKQRVILARGLLKRAKIIILDEALSEVNIDLEKTILHNIFTEFKNETLIYVSHKNVESEFKKIIRIGE